MRPAGICSMFVHGADGEGYEGTSVRRRIRRPDRPLRRRDPFRSPSLSVPEREHDVQPRCRPRSAGADRDGRAARGRASGLRTRPDLAQQRQMLRDGRAGDRHALGEVGSGARPGAQRHQQPPPHRTGERAEHVRRAGPPSLPLAVPSCGAPPPCSPPIMSDTFRHIPRGRGSAGSARRAFRHRHQVCRLSLLVYELFMVPRRALILSSDAPIFDPPGRCAPRGPMRT